ncbi:MAG TPA: tripartite tricarboxylate transporter TctB family protein [Thermomicrobiales bacterium]|jgi:putative tricarboxylic transport membrane protein|nr:tripartite tricarboxylate transporter TctB family protein [Thermomicrobiales bacterium]
MTEESPNTPSPLHPTTPSKRVDIGETLLALAAVVLGILILWQATLIRLTPAYSKVGPRVIPYIVGAGLVIAGVWLAYEALTGRASSAATESEDADPTLPTDWGTVGLLALALVVYLVLIERAGFIIASATLFVMAAFAMGSRRLARDIAIGVILASVLYLVFNRGLGLSLPAGVLTGVV